jgi:hypothetical protein
VLLEGSGSTALAGNFLDREETVLSGPTHNAVDLKDAMETGGKFVGHSIPPFSKIRGSIFR